MSSNEKAKGKCANCGALIYEDDNFCDQCGAKVLRCASCGAILPGGAEFCIKCGFSVARKCSCGAVLSDDALFCPKCGSRVPSGSLSPAPALAPAPAPAAKPALAPALRFEARVGSYVKFGKYPQCHGDTPEPIEWLVLENDGKTALVVSKFGLDCKQFDSSSNNWRDCDLREWLNGEFLQAAFSAEERKQIAESTIYTGDNPKDGTKGCGETDDKVFCLSIEEANKHFGSDNARKCQPTSYAVSRGAWKSTAGYCSFWLRSPGDYAGSAARVRYGGAVGVSGHYVDHDDYAVRPALRIKL